MLDFTFNFSPANTASIGLGILKGLYHKEKLKYGI